MNEDYRIRPDEWIDSRVAKIPSFKPRIHQERVDEEVSHIVGKKILINDARLIKVLTEIKRTKNPDEPDNFLKNPVNVEKIKKALNV